MVTHSKQHQQVIAFTGAITPSAFTGKYVSNGGCANGDQGDVTGFRIPPLFGYLPGTFTSSGGETFNVEAANLKQGSVNSDGSFGLSGIANFGRPCFDWRNFTSGTFPSGSFIMGTSVTLVVETSNGTVTFNGTLDPHKGEITGDYTISGGTCDQTGTGVFDTTRPWDY